MPDSHDTISCDRSVSRLSLRAGSCSPISRPADGVKLSCVHDETLVRGFIVAKEEKKWGKSWRIHTLILTRKLSKRPKSTSPETKRTKVVITNYPKH